jgi:23S rRNA pseudouridine1911/1915/1917 synthase
MQRKQRPADSAKAPKKRWTPTSGNITRITVKEPAELMSFLLDKMGGMKRNSVKTMLSHRQILVNGAVTTNFATELKPGDVVEISSARGNIELSHPKLKMLYEDDAIMVVEKKEGLLTVLTGVKEETTAFSILKTYVQKSSKRNRVYVVHRLDRETSGILMFAKSKEIQLRLQENWHTAVTGRTYVAVVDGMVDKESDTIVSWLSEHEKSLKVRSSNTDDGGQQAITHYKRIKSNEQFSLMELNLETGRKNQIRVHMQGIGHPISGDKKYGSATNPLGRVALHARLLEFYHPVTEKLIRFETPVPRKFLSLFH